VGGKGPALGAHRPQATDRVPRVGPSTSGNRHSGWVSRTSTTQRPRLPSESPRPTQHRYNVGQRGVAAEVVVLHKPQAVQAEHPICTNVRWLSQVYGPTHLARARLNLKSSAGPIITILRCSHPLSWVREETRGLLRWGRWLV
jgi:hypothetical protein